MTKQKKVYPSLTEEQIRNILDPTREERQKIIDFSNLIIDTGIDAYTGLGLGTAASRFISNSMARNTVKGIAKKGTKDPISSIKEQMHEQHLANLGSAFNPKIPGMESVDNALTPAEKQLALDHLNACLKYPELRDQLLSKDPEERKLGLLALQVCEAKEAASNPLMPEPFSVDAEISEIEFQAACMQHPELRQMLESTDPQERNLGLQYLQACKDFKSMGGVNLPEIDVIQIHIGDSAEHKKQTTTTNLTKLGLSAEEANRVVASIEENYPDETDTKLLELNNNLDNIYNKLKHIEEKQRAQEVAVAWQNAAMGAAGLASLGQATGSRELYIIGSITQASIQIAMAINAISSTSTAITTSSTVAACSAFGPVGMIIGAIATLISICSSSGPNPDQIILEQIQNLSKQLVDLHNAMIRGLDQIYKTQLHTLDVVIRGFTKLELVLNEHIAGLRIEFYTAFDRMISTQDFTLAFARASASNQYLQRLKELIEKSQSSTLSDQDVKECTRGLEAWILSLSKNISLNGGLLIEVDKSEIPLTNEQNLRLLRSITNDNDKLQGLVAWLAAYYDINQAKLLPNGMVLHQAAQSYIALQQARIAADVDPDDSQLGKMVNSIDESLQFLDVIKNDADFFKKLQTEYLKKLFAVGQALKDYAKEYSINIHRKIILARNNTHGSQQAALDENALNFFDDPDAFETNFSGRTVDSISKIHTDAIPGSNLVAIPELTNHNRIYEAVRNRVPLAILANEYLKIGNYQCKVVQCAEVKGLDRVSIQYSHGYTWSLPVDLRTADNVDLLCMNFGARWDESKWSAMEFPPRIMWVKRGYATRLYNGLKKYISLWWNDPTVINISMTPHEINTDAPVAAARNTRRNYYQEHRKEICKDLQHGKADSIAAQKFQDALLELDVASARLKAFAYLVGKDPNEGYFAKLFTSEMIRKNLEDFHKDENSFEIRLSFLSTDHLEPQAIDLNNQSDIVLPDTHPRGLLVETKRCLLAHELYKNICRYTNPLLIIKFNYSNEMLRANQRLQSFYWQENKLWMGALLKYASGFAKARNLLKLGDLEAINQKRFDSIHAACLSWGLEASVSTLATGDVSDNHKQRLFASTSPRLLLRPLAEIIHPAANPSYNPVELREMLQLPWQEIIQFLAKLAKDLGAALPAYLIEDNLQNTLNDRLCNPGLWGEGSILFSQLISRADCIDFVDKQRDLRAVNHLIKYGNNFRVFTNVIGMTPILFAELFNGYLDELSNLDSQTNMGLIYSDKHAGKGKSDKLVLHNILDKDNSLFSQVQLVLARMDAYRLIIHSYLQIGFGYEEDLALYLDAKGLSILLNPEAFIAMLQNAVSNDNDSSLLDAIQQHREYVQELLDIILERIEERKAINVFSLKLQGYVQENYARSDLLITQNTSTNLPLTVQHIQVVKQVLYDNVWIRSLKIENVELEENAFIALVLAIRDSEQIKALHFENVEFNKSRIKSLLAICDRLEILDLRNNNLNYDLVCYLLACILSGASKRSTKLQLLLDGNQLSSSQLDECKGYFIDQDMLAFELSDLAMAENQEKPATYMPAMISHPAIDAVMVPLHKARMYLSKTPVLELLDEVSVAAPYFQDMIAKRENSVLQKILSGTEVLDLSAQNMSLTLWYVLAEVLKTGCIKTLILSNTELDNGILAMLADNAQAFMHIVNLNISDNRINDQSYDCLAKILDAALNLEMLDLSGLEFSLDTISNILGCLKKLPNIKILGLNCRLLDADVNDYARIVLPKIPEVLKGELKVIDLHQGLKGVTSSLSANNQLMFEFQGIEQKCIWDNNGVRWVARDSRAIFNTVTDNIVWIDVDEYVEWNIKHANIKRIVGDNSELIHKWYGLKFYFVKQFEDKLQIAYYGWEDNEAFEKKLDPQYLLQNFIRNKNNNWEINDRRIVAAINKPYNLYNILPFLNQETVLVSNKVAPMPSDIYGISLPIALSNNKFVVNNESGICVFDAHSRKFGTIISRWLLVPIWGSDYVCAIDRASYKNYWKITVSIWQKQPDVSLIKHSEYGTFIIVKASISSNIKLTVLPDYTLMFMSDRSLLFYRHPVLSKLINSKFFLNEKIEDRQKVDAKEIHQAVKIVPATAVKIELKPALKPIIPGYTTVKLTKPSPFAWAQFADFTVDPRSAKQAGFNCFDVAVGIRNRIEIVDYALANNKEELRELLAPELLNAVTITAAYLNSSEEERKKYRQDELLPRVMRTEEVREVYNKYFSGADPQAIEQYCRKADIYEQYVSEYYGKTGWFVFNFEEEQYKATSMVDIVAKMLRAKITIYHATSGQYYSTASYGANELHVGYNGYHFVALIPSNRNKADTRLKINS